MNKFIILTLAFFSQFPTACLAASDKNTDPGIGAILGSIIVGAIIIIAIVVEKKKKAGDQGVLYQKVNAVSAIKKIFNKNKVNDNK